MREPASSHLIPLLMHVQGWAQVCKCCCHAHSPVLQLKREKGAPCSREVGDWEQPSCFKVPALPAQSTKRKNQAGTITLLVAVQVRKVDKRRGFMKCFRRLSYNHLVPTTVESQDLDMSIKAASMSSSCYWVPFYGWWIDMETESSSWYSPVASYLPRTGRGKKASHFDLFLTLEEVQGLDSAIPSCKICKGKERWCYS